MQERYDEYGNREHNTSSPRWVFKALWVCTLLAAGAVAFANIRPYINIVKYLGISLLDKALIHMIGSIPIINGLAATGIGVVTLVCGMALWAVFQMIEVLPIIIHNHEGFLEEVIQDAERSKRYKVRPDEDPTVTALKKVYNKLPVAFLENLAKVRMIAYVLDFFICFWVRFVVSESR